MRHRLLLPAALAATLWAADAPARDTLTIGVSQFPANWHPSIDAMAVKSYVLGMTRRPLTTYDPDWNLVCMLCTALPSQADGTAVLETRADGAKGYAVTYTLRPDARWGDGTALTTRDVLFTWEVGRHPLSGFSNAELFAEDIVAITAADERTFTVHRDRPVCTYAELNDFLLLPEHLERPVFEADPALYRQRSTFETDTANPGLYFGPYRIAAVEPGAHVVLEPNPTWWGKAPPFQRVVVKAVENTAALEANLLAGQVDTIPGGIGLPLDQALAFEKRHGDRFAVTYKPGLFYEHLELNLDNPVLADVRVRRALLHAIDRAAISQQLFDGRQPVAHNTVNPLDRVHVPGYPTYAYDPKAAARLLDEAGWSRLQGGVRHDAAGRPLRLTLMSTAGNRSRELLEQVLQAQWKQVGVDVRIANEPPRVLFGQTLRERRFDAMALFAWLSSPENIPRTILHSGMIPAADNGWAGQNYTGYRSAAMDGILDALEVTCAPDANRALWSRLQTLYAEELPALPLYYLADAYIQPPWLKGVEPTGHQYPTTLWIENWRAEP
ncbi:peptide ABC transporter substrate-binding protein [Azospirillum sp. ST 5-10]|uniref:peptide ABC transporter substrate-binding protein n=1 Tax=unclassified Azospirillum TaxID=2630922 RepID=UPI003F4A1BFB